MSRTRDSRTTLRKLSIATGLLLVFLAVSSSASACSCILRKACDKDRYGSVDFAGEVLSRELSSFLAGQQAIYRIRVTESFRGPQRVNEVITVHTRLGGGDCGYRFETGHKYLVDGWNSGGVLSTGICSRTAPIEDSEPDIRFLRMIAEHKPLPSLVGDITRYGSPSGSKGLAGISVSMLALGSGQSWHVRTDENGSYSFAHLTPGTYRISLSRTANLSPESTSFGRLEGDQLPPIAIDAGASLVCHADIALGPSSGVSGLIQPAVGENDGLVYVTAIVSGGKLGDTVLSEPPAADSSFSLNHLQPGRYQIQFIRTEGFKRGAPEMIELKDGERKTGLLLRAK